MTELPPYTAAKARCVKCLNIGASTAYIGNFVNTLERWGRLLRCCGNCGYEWAEACAAGESVELRCVRCDAGEVSHRDPTGEYWCDVCVMFVARIAAPEADWKHQCVGCKKAAAPAYVYEGKALCETCWRKASDRHLPMCAHCHSEPVRRAGWDERSGDEVKLCEACWRKATK